MPSENDDFHPDEVLDCAGSAADSWVGGTIELAEERPTTALSGDPTHRKWMLMGVGGCGLVTAVAVLLLTRNPTPAQATPSETAPSETTPAPTAIEPAPAIELAETPTVDEPASKPSKQILAATSPAATQQKAPNKAPPPPAVTPAAPPKPAPASKPAPTPTPVPAPGQPAANPAANSSELPDVEGWDDADAAVESEEPIEEPPAASEPLESVEPEPTAEANAEV